MSQHAYSCAKCGLAVIVIPGHKPFRACRCQATVYANMTGTLTVLMGAREKKP